MSARRLVAYVFVRDERGRSVRFGPHDDVPDWAAEKIRNPRAWAADEEPDDQPGEDDTAGTHEDQGQAPTAPAAPAHEDTDEGQAPTVPDAQTPAPPVEQPQPAEAVQTPPPVVAESPPPRSGKGSGTPVWAGYAQRHGVQVGEHDTREDIIAALDAAGIPTD